MKELLKLFRKRVASEQGSVAVLVALAIFVVCGMLTMTWNTAQLSKEKMRLQNAADAAALEYCIWQARGMNAVQNVNDEASVLFDTGEKLLRFTTKVETGLSLIPFPPVQVVFEVLLCAVPGALSGLMTGWCPYILKGASYFYVYGSWAIGYLGAQQIAHENGASSFLGDWVTIGDASIGLYAIGCTTMPHKDMLFLPLYRDESPGEPFVGEADAAQKAVLKKSMISALYSFAKTGDKWEFFPYVSKRKDAGNGASEPEEKPEEDKADEDSGKKDGKDGKDGDEKKKKEEEEKKDKEKEKEEERSLGHLPSPSIWVAIKYKNEIQTLPLETWAGDEAKSAMHDSPIIAIAAAQCITGDVVKHNDEPDKDGKFKGVNNRPVGFGAGATAKLIPIAEALRSVPSLGSILDTVAGLAIYH